MSSENFDTVTGSFAVSAFLRVCAKKLRVGDGDFYLMNTFFCGYHTGNKINISAIRIPAAKYQQCRYFWRISAIAYIGLLAAIHFRTMKRTLLIAIGLLVGTVVHGQDYYETFKKLSAAKDSVGQRNLLEGWKKKNGDDPELYTSCFNYYVQKSMSEVIRLDSDPQTGKNLQITDSSSQVVGYIHGETSYNPKYLSLGFDIIEKGITKFPNRLDMRFGKIHMLGQVNNYHAFTDEIVKSIDFSIKNKNKWQWTKNELVKEPKDFLLDNIQTYINNLFDLGDGQAKNIRRIAETTLKYYPDHVVSLSNLGISYIFENNYFKALDPLLTAEKKTPKDPIILGNIAYVYVNLKENKKATEYYEKVIQFGDDNARRFAEQQLKKLEK